MFEGKKVTVDGMFEDKKIIVDQAVDCLVDDRSSKLFARKIPALGAVIRAVAQDCSNN